MKAYTVYFIWGFSFVFGRKIRPNNKVVIIV